MAEFTMSMEYLKDLPLGLYFSFCTLMMCPMH